MPDQDPLVAQPVESQAQWSPPGGDVDFDSLFGGAGDGSSDILQAEEATPVSVEPTTASPEPVPQAPPAPVPQAQPEFVIKTPTGTVYKSLEEAERGIAEKDTQLQRMRSMIEAATGVDPMKRGNSAAQTAPTSYLSNSTQYAQDLTRAAELGNKTGNWDPYLKTQLTAFGEYLQQTVGSFVPVLQDVGKQKALDSVTSEISDFKDFYGTPAYRQTLESRPALKDAIARAESDPSQSKYLPELYKSANDARNTGRLADALKQPPPTNSTTTPRMPMGSSRLTAPAVVGDSTLGARAAGPTLASSAGRKALMAELESKGILDRNF